MSWLSAFIATQLVEVPIYTLAMRGRPHLAFAASLITHPIVWFLLPILGLRYPIYVITAESFAIIAEAAFLHYVAKLRHAWAWSLAANASSVIIGLTLRAMIGWP